MRTEGSAAARYDTVAEFAADLSVALLDLELPDMDALDAIGEALASVRRKFHIFQEMHLELAAEYLLTKGQQGVKSVECLEGDAVWAAGREGRILSGGSMKPARRCLRCGSWSRRLPAARCARATPDGTARKPIVLSARCWPRDCRRSRARRLSRRPWRSRGRRRSPGPRA